MCSSLQPLSIQTPSWRSTGFYAMAITKVLHNQLNGVPFVIHCPLLSTLSYALVVIQPDFFHIALIIFDGEAWSGLCFGRFMNGWDRRMRERGFLKNSYYGEFPKVFSCLISENFCFKFSLTGDVFITGFEVLMWRACNFFFRFGHLVCVVGSSFRSWTNAERVYRLGL